MKTNKRALWFWSTDHYAIPFNHPAVQYAVSVVQDYIQPAENEYPYKPWDVHYDRRKDPAMLILDDNKRLEHLVIKRRNKRIARKASR
jgi:hypothetical protein